MDLLPVRKALALMIFEAYSNVEDVDELPQVLVQAFDMLTEIARLDGTPCVTCFEKWWNRRDVLLRKGWLSGE